MTSVAELAARFSGKLSPSQLHDAVYDRFILPGHDRTFAFTGIHIAGGTVAYLRGDADHMPEGARAVSVPTVGETRTFTIRVLATRSSGGRRFFFPRNDLEGRATWFWQKAEQGGFRLLEVEELETRSETIEDRKRRHIFAVTTFSGVLEVTDAEAFAHTLVHGIGRGKTWGYGLLHVHPNKEI